MCITPGDVGPVFGLMGVHAFRRERKSALAGSGLQNSDSTDYQTGGKEDCQKHAVFAPGSLYVTFTITLGDVFGQPGNICTVFSLMGVHTFTNNDARPSNFVRSQAEQGER